MGTRNLTIVCVDGKYPVAQYGQWDGYPAGQGVKVLEFCKKHLRTKAGRQAFAKKIARVQFVDEKGYTDLCKKHGIHIKGEWINMEQAEQIKKKLPAFSRDTAAEILNLIRDSGSVVYTTDDIGFAADSLFCEWAYVVDLDKGRLEVYSGINTERLADGERFSFLNSSSVSRCDAGDKVYYPVKLVKSYPLGKLPSEEKFIKDNDPE